MYPKGCPVMVMQNLVRRNLFQDKRGLLQKLLLRDSLTVEINPRLNSCGQGSLDILLKKLVFHQFSRAIPPVSHPDEGKLHPVLGHQVPVNGTLMFGGQGSGFPGAAGGDPAESGRRGFCAAGAAATEDKVHDHNHCHQASQHGQNSLIPSPGRASLPGPALLSVSCSDFHKLSPHLLLRDDGPVKVSRTIKENGVKVKMARQKLQGSEGREPTLQEIARETGLDVEDVVLAMEASVEVEMHQPP